MSIEKVFDEAAKEQVEYARFVADMLRGKNPVTDAFNANMFNLHGVSDCAEGVAKCAEKEAERLEKLISKEVK